MLQRDLDTLQAWVHKWNMSFNSAKCKFLRVSNKQSILSFPYTIQDTAIRKVTQAKYLGVTLNNKLTWSSHISNITNKANSVYDFLRCNFSNCTTKIKGELYKSMVRPILEYACNVWCPHYNKDIQLANKS